MERNLIATLHKMVSSQCWFLRKRGRQRVYMIAVERLERILHAEQRNHDPEYVSTGVGHWHFGIHFTAEFGVFGRGGVGRASSNIDTLVVMQNIANFSGSRRRNWAHA